MSSRSITRKETIKRATCKTRRSSPVARYRAAGDTVVEFHRGNEERYRENDSLTIPKMKRRYSNEESRFGNLASSPPVSPAFSLFFRSFEEDLRRAESAGDKPARFVGEEGGRAGEAGGRVAQELCCQTLGAR